MCEQYSWIVKDKKVIFLTAKDVFHSKRGRELRKHTTYAEDWHGHGAIRWFYNFKGGKNRECTDFSTPDNFPDSLVKAIKTGRMWEFGITSDMLIMLMQPALKEYDDVEQAAVKEYKAVEQAAWKEYGAALEQVAVKEYKDVKQAAWKEYDDVEQAAVKEYKDVKQAAVKEYKAVEQAAFVSLWTDAKNRKKSWR